MKVLRRLNRRSFLGAVSGGTLILIPRGAGAVVQGCSDTDSGTGADPGGHGRRCASRPQTGVTDRDTGPNADPAGRGRNTLPEMHGGQPSTWTTDQDPTDPAGRGRGPYGLRRSGVTDSDRGANADPAGNGRGPRPGQQAEQDRWQSCVSLAGRRNELRRELQDPQYWGTDERDQAADDANRIDRLFARDEDGYLGDYRSMSEEADRIAGRYGLRCGDQQCTNVAYELRARAARAGGSYESGVAMRGELARIEDSIGRNCPNTPR